MTLRDRHLPCFEKAASVEFARGRLVAPESFSAAARKSLLFRHNSSHHGETEKEAETTKTGVIALKIGSKGLVMRRAMVGMFTEASREVVNATIAGGTLHDARHGTV